MIDARSPAAYIEARLVTEFSPFEGFRHNIVSKDTEENESARCVDGGDFDGELNF